jgi:hypothetical protein
VREEEDRRQKTAEPVNRIGLVSGDSFGIGERRTDVVVGEKRSWTIPSDLSYE